MAVVLAVALAGAGVMLAWDPADHPVADAPAVSILPVDPATVSAAASSTQGADGAITYTAANTLDGDPTTAWNSNGAPLSGGRTWLRYTFAGPVDLRSVSVLNGYQKVRPRAGKTSLDLYPANRRARQVRVVTDTGSFVWNLADTRSRQTFTEAAGRTTSLRLEMLTSYPSTAYPDLAISEVSFTAAVPA